MRLLVRICTVLAVILSTATVAYAQASIAGVVRDTSGAVLPGVTVEASSPALIEKVRTVTTDGTGQYRIVDLRPGVYSVTFSLSGFNAFKRDGIELEGSFVATVNAELRVGELTETITVSGESPLVDVQSVRTTQTIDNELFSSIPDQPAVLRPHGARARAQYSGAGCRRHEPRQLQRVPGPRRTAQRRAGPGGRPQHRLGRNGRLELRSGSQRRAGSDVHAERWNGRGADRRAADEHRAQAGRQHVLRQLLHVLRRRRLAGHQSHRRTHRRRSARGC